MNAQKFHQSMESKIGSLAIIAGLVINNEFDNATKEKVFNNLETAKNAILENRAEAYKELEDFDFDTKIEIKEPVLDKVDVNNRGHEVNKIAFKISDIASGLKKNHQVDYVMHHISLKKMQKSKTFKANEEAFIEALDSIITLVNTSEKQATEEVAPLNPEAKNKKESVVLPEVTPKIEDPKPTDNENDLPQSDGPILGDQKVSQDDKQPAENNEDKE